MRRVLLFAAGVMAGLLLSGGALLFSFPQLMIHETASPYGVDETVQAIQSEALRIHWKVPKVYDFRESLIKQGQADPGPVQVVQLCNPVHAGKMLAADASKFVSVMMPCTVAVYQKSDGRTYIATLNVGLMGRLFGGDIASIMGTVEREHYAMLAFAGQ